MNTPTKNIGINADADRPQEIGAHLLPARFDYGTVAAEVADELRAKASKILGLTVRATETILAIGREFINAKDQIAHGNFECWAETEARISIRAAQQYMSVARFADKENKSATIALFPPATAYRLVAKNVPPEIQLEVLERAESGDILPDGAIADMIARANSEKQQARVPIIKAKRKAEFKKRLEQRRRDREDYEAKEKRQQEADQAKARSILGNLGIENVRSLLEDLGDTSYPAYYRTVRVLDYLKALASEAAHDVGDDDDAEEPPTVPEQLESSDITTLVWGGMVPCGSSHGDDHSNRSAPAPGGTYTAMVGRNSGGAFTHYSVSYVISNKKSDKVKYLGSAKSLEVAKEIAQQHAEKLKAEAA